MTDAYYLMSSLRMKHALPYLLNKLLASGVWPSDPKTAMAQNIRSLVPPDRVRRFAAEEDRIHLSAPPFRTIADHVKSASPIVVDKFWNVLGGWIKSFRKRRLFSATLVWGRTHQSSSTTPVIRRTHPCSAFATVPMAIQIGCMVRTVSPNLWTFSGSWVPSSNKSFFEPRRARSPRKLSFCRHFSVC